MVLRLKPTSPMLLSRQAFVILDQMQPQCSVIVLQDGGCIVDHLLQFQSFPLPVGYIDVKCMRQRHQLALPLWSLQVIRILVTIILYQSKRGRRDQTEPTRRSDRHSTKVTVGQQLCRRRMVNFTWKHLHLDRLACFLVLAQMGWIYHRLVLLQLIFCSKRRERYHFWPILKCCRTRAPAERTIHQQKFHLGIWMLKAMLALRLIFSYRRGSRQFMRMVKMNLWRT
mmetsp:Transcript_20652/g.45117  ORF Transcript_20652/g.45117 Transcript_20652/m.45117 type:complete len:226 (+) Transcript_20652:237-914(+)